MARMAVTLNNSTLASYTLSAPSTPPHPPTAARPNPNTTPGAGAVQSHCRGRRQGKEHAACWLGASSMGDSTVLSRRMHARCKRRTASDVSGPKQVRSASPALSMSDQDAMDRMSTPVSDEARCSWVDPGRRCSHFPLTPLESTGAGLVMGRVC
ncbi:hypothetical protein BP5796_00591 [Coleophoma crateriformis]|uniref:Uncharacterized protein n=1 Tax=Coleophoma crateriformis TaxID=565419 RepID=A0A3D8T9Y6_9HELO|nr:hypothetical protein BP5796_00591 [Coleophoma crateriformis]